MDSPTTGTDITSFTGSTKQTVVSTTDGIPLPAWDVLYYELPLINISINSVSTNFYIVTQTSTAWIPKHNWILLASHNGDPNSSNVKWLPGNVIIPNPESGTIIWSENNFQIGQTINQVSLHGGTGTS
jgi:hypothetical protein